MQSAENAQYLSTLHKQIDQYFSLSEVQTICFDLGVDYENIPGNNKSAFIRNLILSMARQNRLQDLVNIVRKERKFVDWQDTPPDFQLPSSVAREDIRQVHQYTVYGDVYQGNVDQSTTNIDTDGGNYIGGDQNIQGDSVQGDKVAGDKVSGNKISIDNLDIPADFTIEETPDNFTKAQQSPIQQETNIDLEDFRQVTNDLDNSTGVPDSQNNVVPNDSESDLEAVENLVPEEDPPLYETNQPEEIEPNKSETEDETDTTVNITELSQPHDTDIYLVQTARPWLLPVNAMVISVGVKGGMQGGLSQAIRREIGEDIWGALKEQVQKEVSTISPAEPVLITLDASLGSQILPNAPEMPDGTTTHQIIAATPTRPNSDGLDPETAASAIIKLALENNITHLAIPLLGSGRGRLNSVRVVEGMVKAIYWAIPDTDHSLQNIFITTRPDRDDVVAAAQNTIDMLTANRAQKLSADSATGEDTLGIKTEVYALAETLLLRDVETPLAVGILGGWGSGKSFAMHLMQQEMMRIRSLEVSKGWEPDESEPYVGHLYPIEFNAWTYAKSDLWASLMQTIFMDLNKQLSLEQLFTQEQLMAGGANWLELNLLGEQELEALLETEVGADAIKDWQMGKTPDSLWVAYNEMRVKELTEMEAVKEKRQEVEIELQQFEANQQQQIEAAAREEVWKQLVGTAVTSTVAKEIQATLEKNFSQDDLEDLTKLGVQLKQLRPTMPDLWQRKNMIHMLWQSKWIILLAIILLALPMLITWPTQAIQTLPISPDIMSWLGSIGATLLAGFRIYQAWSDKVQRWLAGINDAMKLANEMMTTEESKLIQQKQVEMTAERQKLENKLNELNAQIDRHQQRMGVAGEFNTLQDFVSARLKDRDYEERLGMLHRAQADLQELTDTLTVHSKNDLHAEAKQKFFPRGPARVVLFIDDLDRCPPPKVVEVLEAIQLLLRTELFVVVLGLDTRYVTRALEKQYAGILQHHGDPSGLDYIEKIIQIPYRVRPIEPKNLRTFLEAQMEMVVQKPEQEEDGGGVVTIPLERTTEPISRSISKEIALDEVDTEESLTAGQASPKEEPIESATPEGLPETTIEEESETIETEVETLSPQVVKFHHEDFADLEQACVTLGLTPRSIKRLINVLKLMKVFWFRTSQNKNQDEIRTVINLLTLAARFPEIMVQVFHNIEMAYRDDSKGEDQLSVYLTNDLTNGGVLYQKESFETAVSNLNFNTITLKDLELNTFNLVRSFSFVGDPVYEESKTG